MTRAIKVALVRSVAALALAVVAVAPAAQAKTSATKYPYTYTNPDGSKTIIPSRPKRVVALNNMDGLSGLGAHVVGAVQSLAPGEAGGTAIGQPGWLNGGELKGVVSVGGFDPPDFERIAALRPDLIIGGDSPAIRAKLSAIAPTVGSVAAKGADPLAARFSFADDLLRLAPIFDAKEHVDEVIARMRQRVAAVSPFVRGTSVAVLIPLAGAQNFYLVANNANTADFFKLAGAKLQTSVPGGTSAFGGVLQSVSTESLPAVTASKVLVVANFNTESEAGFKSRPLYPQIPAVKTGQIYFTQWQFAGAVGTADYITQFSREMFGVAPLEATLAGAGRRGAARSGVADVDVGPTQQRVCWAISTSTNVGRPKSAAVVDKRGARLFALGKRYAANGCTNISRSAGSRLRRFPGRYRVSIDTARTKRVLLGGLGAQSPAFFGTGKDRPFTQ